MKEKIPTYGICNLVDEDHSLQNIQVYDLPDFISSHQDLVFPHRHSFYLVLYLVEGAGNNIIDFETNTVKAGSLYCIAPGEVHTWLVEGPVKGYLINFNESFFSSFLLNSRYLSDFLFLSGNSKYGVYRLPEDISKAVVPYFDPLLREQEENNLHKNDEIRTTVLQLCICIRGRFTLQFTNTGNVYNYNILRSFEKLMEQNYLRIKLPKEYAELLFITPNHL